MHPRLLLEESYTGNLYVSPVLVHNYRYCKHRYSVQYRYSTSTVYTVLVHHTGMYDSVLLYR